MIGFAKGGFTVASNFSTFKKRNMVKLTHQICSGISLRCEMFFEISELQLPLSYSYISKNSYEYVTQDEKIGLMYTVI